MESEPHRFRLRVYYEDTDAAGIVYYANYLKFAERARTELLRERGVEQRRLAAERGLAFAVRSCAAEYMAPARLDDEIEVRSRLVRLKGAALDAEQDVARLPDGETLASLRLRIACLGRDGRPTRIPSDVARALAAPAAPHFGQNRERESDG